MLFGDRADQLLDENGLADAGAAEQADLAALRVRREEVDDLDPRLEDLLSGSEVLDRRGGAMDRPALFRLDVARVVDRLAEQVEDAAERVLAHGHRDRPARVDHVVAALKAVGGVHRDGADAVVAEVLLNLEGQVHPGALVGLLDLDLERRVDLRELAGEARRRRRRRAPGRREPTLLRRRSQRRRSSLRALGLGRGAAAVPSPFSSRSFVAVRLVFSHLVSP